MPYSKFKAKIKITNLYILIFYSKLKEEEYLFLFYIIPKSSRSQYYLTILIIN